MPYHFNRIMRVRFSVYCFISDRIYSIYQYVLCYEIITTGTSNSFIQSRALHRQSGAMHFYSCCLWISVDRGAVVTYGEVSK